VTLTYGYDVAGVPIRFSDGRSAASITLSGTAVSGLEFSPRQYTAVESRFVLLPARQAAAIAGQYGKKDLFIGYAGDGSGKLEARWLVE